MVVGSQESKSATIKQRAIYVYLPSHEMVARWKQLAERSGGSISKFVIEHVENSLRQEEGEEEYISRTELVDEIRVLREENRELQKRNRMLDTVVDRLEKELREYRSKPFAEDEAVGVRKYQSDLLDLFKKRGVIRKDELLELLDVDPSETVTIKGIRKQIEGLEEYGVIRDVGAKWKWVP
jgi:hypothetical protein